MRNRVVAAACAIVVAGLGGALSVALLTAGRGATRLISGEVTPLNVVAELESEGGCGGPGWVFPVSRKQLTLPGLDENRELWARLNRGISASGSKLIVDLQSVRGRTVIVDDATIKVSYRSSPIRGTSVSVLGQCEGVHPDYFIADLDRRRIIPVRPIIGTNATRGVRSVPFPHVISETRPEVWYIEATTKSCTCDWVLQIDWTSDGQRETTAIKNGSKPFQVAATKLAHHISIY